MKGDDKVNNIEVAKNFHLREFECKDGSHQVMLHSELLQRLQKLRDILNKPVIITSGYRNQEHNRRVGGAPNSYHLRGMAADITVQGTNPQDLAKTAEECGFRGIGVYEGFLHVDVRQQRARW